MVKFTKFTEHQPVDVRDPGFKLPGFKLRWLGPELHERRTGRIWFPIRVSMLPQELLAKLKAKNPFWFEQMEGDTIRRRGDVLSFAPIDEVQQLRKELDEKTKAQSGIFNRRVSNAVLNRGRGDVETESSSERITFGKEDFE